MVNKQNKNKGDRVAHQVINLNETDSGVGRTVQLVSLNHSVSLTSDDPKDSLKSMSDLASALLSWMHDEVM